MSLRSHLSLRLLAAFLLVLVLEHCRLIEQSGYLQTSVGRLQAEFDNTQRHLGLPSPAYETVVDMAAMSSTNLALRQLLAAHGIVVSVPSGSAAPNASTNSSPGKPEESR